MKPKAVSTAGGFFVYVTRPEANELYNGGWRRVRVWMAEPNYSHAPRTVHSEPEVFVADHGWSGDSAAAKTLLQQDRNLLRKVWHQILWSVVPRGIGDHDAAVTWADVPKNWDRLCEPGWEAGTNRCHKRLLIRVEIRSSTIDLVAPRVDVGDRDSPATELPRTVEITSERALEHFHAASPHHLPF